jgi:uncharacterized cupin superfamily protein
VAVFNLLGDDWDETHERDGYRWRSVAIGGRIGAERIGCSVYELEPGQRTFPYHFHHGNEEWLLALSGRPTLRTPEGDRELRAGDLVAFPAGPDGAHAVANRTDEPARVAIFSTLRLPSIVMYPDSDKIRARWSYDEDGALDFRRADEVDYWEGE